MKKKYVATGLLAGLVAGTGAGLIIEQTGFAGASSNAAVVVEDDSGTGGDTARPRPDPSARLTEVLQPLVDNGTITADQLTTIVETLRAAGPMGVGPGGHGGPGGPGGSGGPGGPGHPGRPGGRGHGIDTAATAIGVTVDELHSALQDGQTIAEVAASEGVDVQTVIDAMVAEAQAHLAERVTAGDLTQDEADAKLAEITTRITDVVNNGRPDRPADAPVPGADDTSTTTAG
ncbi:MAG: hypothetical protein AAB131_21815 [Actinomycetota bacterium]